MAGETFDSKLKQMEYDLISIITKMNKDRACDKAEVAQVALTAIVDLRRDNDYFVDLNWDWEPQEE
jgi:hypothetical protein